MNAYKKQFGIGFTLIEIIVAIVVIVTAVIGAMGFRYYCALDAKKADVQITAGRMAWALLEDWRAYGGRNTYDPINEFTSELNISSDSGLPAALTNEVGTGYKITADGVSYYATLSYGDDAGLVERTMNVSVAWPQNYDTGELSTGTRAVRLTTYVDTPSFE